MSQHFRTLTGCSCYAFTYMLMPRREKKKSNFLDIIYDLRETPGTSRRVAMSGTRLIVLGAIMFLQLILRVFHEFLCQISLQSIQ